MYKVVKLAADRILALLGLIILSPLFLVLMLAIRLPDRCRSALPPCR